jgi:hypothetical protein
VLGESTMLAVADATAWLAGDQVAGDLPVPEQQCDADGGETGPEAG